jgi:DNA invertase Pin-like site-specific DNA recombinase
VAIYVRVSTKDKGQDVDNQLLQLKEYCTKNEYQVFKIYSDNESGQKGRKERIEFDLMFKDAHQKIFDMLLFWSLDRFTREGLFKTITYLQMLDSYGVTFHSFTEEYLNTDNEMVRSILIAILSHLAKVEAVKISERTRAGLERAKANGKKLGRPSMKDNLLPKIQKLKDQNLSDGEICRRLKISRNTLKKYLS